MWIVDSSVSYTYAIPDLKSEILIKVWFLIFLIGVKNEVVYETSQALLEKLAVEAFQVAMVRANTTFCYLFFYFGLEMKLFLDC